MSKGEKLPDNVRALGQVSFMNDMASDMIVPLLPAFLLKILGSATPVYLGLIEGVAETTAALFKLLSGWLSDRIKKRKGFATFGYGLSNAVRPLIALSTTGWHVLFLRFADRLGKGVRTSPRDALLSASVRKEEWGRAFGYQRAMDNLGATVGPLFASLFLFIFPDRLRELFLLSVIPGIFVVYVLIVRVKESTPKEASHDFKKSEVHLSGSVPQGPFRTFLIASFLFTLGNSTDMFLILRAQNIGVSLALVPILWALLGLVRAGSGTPGGRIADKIGRKRSILIGWFVYALVYAGFGFASQTWHIWGLFVVYGLYYGMVEGAERAYVAEFVSEETRGAAYGWYYLSIGVGALPASLIFGLIWKIGGDKVGSEVAFLFGAAMALAASIMLLKVRKGRIADVSESGL